MRVRFLLAGPALALFSLLPMASARQEDGPETTAEESAPAARDVHHLRPEATGAELVDRVRAARDRGVAFLLRNQNPDGSFGSHDPKIPNLADFGFQLLNRGSQDGVRLACTALCAQALLELPDRGEAEQAALERAIDALLDTRKFAYEIDEPFNTWGYGYKLDFLTRLLDADLGKGRGEAIREAAELCIVSLLRYQQHEGGWGYYASQMNDFESMSFNTAVFLAALKRAADRGLDVPPGMIDDAARCVMSQRVPDGSFVYSTSHIKSGGSRLANLGSGSRTVACAYGLHTAGRYRDDDLLDSLRVFHWSENYLESGRKLIVPHSAPHAISGYFFFFGYYYAAEVARRLGDRVETEDWERLVWQMVRTQEKDGCWWDTASGHYGDKWGTAFALLCIHRYLGEMERREAARSEGAGR